MPIEKKESIRWLENLRQATELLGDPKRCVHIGDRESDIYELFCLAVLELRFRRMVVRPPGCRAEEAKLRTAERLVNLIAILTILSWRIF